MEDDKTGETMGLWRMSKRPDAKEGKYLVLHVGDRSVLQHPNIVLGARDPATPAALKAYAGVVRGWRFVGALGRDAWIVLRRDGTAPTWPFAVLHALDPAAPGALMAYADAADAAGLGEAYAEDVRELATQFDNYRIAFSRLLSAGTAGDRATLPIPYAQADDAERYAASVEAMAAAFSDYRAAHGQGDPSAVPHRRDDPGIIALMRLGRSA